MAQIYTTTMSINHCPLLQGANPNPKKKGKKHWNIFDGKAPNCWWSLTHYWEDNTWKPGQNLANLYERAYMMGLKWNMSKKVEATLSEYLTTRKWEAIALSKEMWAPSQQEPSNNAPSPSAPDPRRNKRKRSQVSGGSSSNSSSKKVKATDGSSR